MKRFATALVALSVLATGAAHAAGMAASFDRSAYRAAAVQAEKAVQVPAYEVLSAKELNKRGISPETLVTVSDFSVQGPHSSER